MSLPDDTFIRTALQITGHFEDSTDPFGGVSGDFDGMGLSLGVLQWNIGMGSLQEMVTAVGRAAVIDVMPIYGEALWRACEANIAKGLEIVRSWQYGAKLRKPVIDELKQFAHSKTFMEQQIIKAHKVAEKSWNEASNWNAQTGRDIPSLQEFCWFFDLITQNGGLKGICPSDVNNFIEGAGVDHVDDLICDYIENCPSTVIGFKDAIKNTKLWRDAVPETFLGLIVASYLRSQKSRIEYRIDVLNRKATIAMKKGWVHGELHDFTEML